MADTKIFPDFPLDSLRIITTQDCFNAVEQIGTGDGNRCGRDGFSELHGMFFTILGPRNRVTGSGSLFQRLIAILYFGFFVVKSGTGLFPGIQ